MSGESLYDFWYIDDIRIADGLIEPVVDKGVVDRPSSIVGTIGVPTQPVYGLAYEPGLTDSPGQGAGITAQLGFGPDGSHPVTWPEPGWVEASYNGDAGDHDEYMATITPIEGGVFDYAFRFRIEGSPTWIYADLDGNDTGGGGENAYSVDQAGELTVPGPTLCEEDDTGDIDIVSTASPPGVTVSIPVRIQDAPNAVSSLGFDLTYDSTLLTFTGPRLGELVEGFDYFSVSNPEPGRLIAGGFTSTGGIEAGESGDIVYLEFNVSDCEKDSSSRLDLQELKDDIASWWYSHGCFQCGCDCDINGNGEVTPEDALCAFKKYLEICPTDCGPCEEICCDVNHNADCTPADALEIFKEYLGMGSVCSSQ
jgi:hypothetical protein